MSLRDRTFLVAGGASGIGGATAEELAKSGAHLVLTSRSNEKLQFQKAQLEMRHHAVQITTLNIDLTSDGTEETLKNELKRIGCSLAGAAFCVGSGRPILGSRTARLTKSLQLNLLSATRFLDGVIEFMKLDSSLVFVSSIAGLEKIDAPAEYSASKSALQVMVKNWAEEFAPRRINSVAPGNVHTENSIWAKRAQTAPKKLAKFLESTLPLGRLAEPSEIAEAVVFLLSARSSFITGTTLTVDGGQTRSYA